MPLTTFQTPFFPPPRPFARDPRDRSRPAEPPKIPGPELASGSLYVRPVRHSRPDDARHAQPRISSRSNPHRGLPKAPLGSTPWSLRASGHPRVIPADKIPNPKPLRRATRPGQDKPRSGPIHGPACSPALDASSGPSAGYIAEVTFWRSLRMYGSRSSSRKRTFRASNSSLLMPPCHQRTWLHGVLEI